MQYAAIQASIIEKNNSKLIQSKTAVKIEQSSIPKLLANIKEGDLILIKFFLAASSTKRAFTFH